MQKLSKNMLISCNKIHNDPRENTPHMTDTRDSESMYTLGYVYVYLHGGLKSEFDVM